MPDDDEQETPAQPPAPPAVSTDDTVEAPRQGAARRASSVELDQTLAAGSSDGRQSGSTTRGSADLDETLAAEEAAGGDVAIGSRIRPPRPLAETVGATSDPAIPLREQRVDRYLLDRRLGAGGMGVVYKATDSELGRTVAIKMMKSGLSAERLRREAQALARLDHPNVVTVYDVGEHEGRAFVAMEFVDGWNLHGWCEQAHSTDEILRVLYDAAAGIIAAHEAGMIHRDLKPDNIFIAKDGRVMVGDFGLARDADDEDGKGFDTSLAAQSLTQTGHVLGTPAYMAPEQAEGEATERSDQFSFCVTAYEALYGTRPFPGATFQEILDRVDSGSIEAPVRRRRVPGRIARAIRRGLSADPRLRFRSMRELIKEMRGSQRPVWPYLAGAGLLAAAATVAIVVAKRESGSAASACAAAGNVDTLWNPQRRATLVVHLQQRQFQPAAAEEIAKRLDDYTSRWSTHRRESCVAESQGTLDARHAAARSLCQSLALAAFEEALQSFETDTDSNVMDAAKRASTLPAIEGCASDDALKLAVASVEHEKIMRELAATERTLDLAELSKLRERAAAANDVPAQLEISITEGRRALELGTFPAAEAAIQRGMPLAEQLDAPASRARLLALAAHSRCLQNKDPETFLPMAEAAGKRLDPTRNAIGVSAVLEARAACLIRRPDPAPAVPVLEELIQHIEDRNAMDLDELQPRSDLALVYRRLGRDADAEKQEALVRDILGRYVTDTSILGTEELNKSNAAFMAGDLHAAIAHHERAATLLTQPIHKAQAFGTLAMYYDVLADFRTAVATHDKVIAILETLPSSPFNEEILADSLAFGGWDRLYLDDVEGALGQLEKALPLATKLEKTELTAVAQLGLARVWLARKEYARAIRFAQEGLATHAKLGDAAQFRVAMGLFALAQAQWAVGDKFVARETGKAAEIAVAKGLEQSRAHVLGSFGLPFKQKKAEEIAHWRETHK